MTKFTILLAFAGIAAVAGACREVHGETAPPPRPVKIAPVRPIQQPAGIRYAVSIQPREQISLAFKTSGYVDAVQQRRGADGRARLLQGGDLVQAGAALARVRDAEYQERVTQAQASMAELETAEGKARVDLDRAKALYAAEALVRPDLDAAQAAYDANVARMASARAQHELATIGLRDTVLVAPSSGIVLERKIEIGSLVGAGSVAFVLADVSSVKALFGVPDALVHRLAPGQPLTITTEAFHGSKFPGRITAVSPSADAQSRVFDVEVTIPNGDGRLRPGMIGSVEILSAAPASTAIEPGIPAIPLTAIVRSADRPDQYSVFVVDGIAEQSTVRARGVTLGAIQGNLVAVTAGLSSGERVVVMGATLLKDGEAVRVIP
jgi:RND family efflux transporter MFP subunit